MSEARTAPTTPPPSLFVSYASEDREAARRLRDAIAEHGIEVWYDEDELTGGDAWDQKIRQRIRECDYFMPVISHATEARREGYFRREWRQAAERTLDMADDVMFIVPVSIDDITEAGSRVPERFHQVHWTKCPAGQANAALEELCQRMLADDETVPVAPPSPVSTRARAQKPPRQPPPPDAKKGRQLPPYPSQPQRKPDDPAWLHAFNLCVWVVQCGYRAYRGFPRVLRWMVIIWFFFFLVGRCQAPKVQIEDPTGVAEDLIETSLQGVDDEGTVSGLGKFLGAVADFAQAGQTFAIVPFTTDGADESTTEFANAVLQKLIGSLESSYRDHISFSPVPLGQAPSETELITRIGRTESAFLFSGWVDLSADDGLPRLHLIIQPADRSITAWRQQFAIVGNTPEAVAAVVATQIEEMAVFANIPVVTPAE